jgi:hypothetical protein
MYTCSAGSCDLFTWHKKFTKYKELDAVRANVLFIISWLDMQNKFRIGNSSATLKGTHARDFMVHFSNYFGKVGAEHFLNKKL